MSSGRDAWADGEFNAQCHMTAAENRPAIVVEWLDGSSAFYTLLVGSAVEDTDGRKLVIKRKDTDEDGHPTGAQHHRTVIPFEVLRGWTVYPLLIEPPPIHERLPGGAMRCGNREVGAVGVGQANLPGVTCQTCINLRRASFR